MFDGLSGWHGAEDGLYRGSEVVKRKKARLGSFLPGRAYPGRGGEGGGGGGTGMFFYP